MKKLHAFLSLGVLAATSALYPALARAQIATTSDTSQGDLGKRYGGLNFAVGDPAHSSDNIYGTSIGVNVPVTSFLDISGGYSYSWFNTDYGIPNYSWRSVSQGLGTDFVFYKQIAGGLKPFISAGIAYEWAHLTMTGNSYYGYYNTRASDDRWAWHSSVGIEIPFRWFSLTPSIDYSDDFKDSRESAQSWSYALNASSWITPKVGVMAGVAYSEPKHNPDGSYVWSYTAGVRFRF